MVSCESQHIVNSDEKVEYNTIYEYVFSEKSQHSVIFGPTVSHSENKTYETLVTINRNDGESYAVVVSNKVSNDYARTYSYNYKTISDFRTDIETISRAVENGVTSVSLKINSNYVGKADVDVIQHDDYEMLHIKYGSLNFIFPLMFLK